MPREVRQALVSMIGDQRLDFPSSKPLVRQIAPNILGEPETQRILNICPPLNPALIGTAKPVSSPQNKRRGERRVLLLRLQVRR